MNKSWLIVVVMSLVVVAMFLGVRLVAGGKSEAVKAGAPTPSTQPVSR